MSEETIVIPEAPLSPEEEVSEWQKKGFVDTLARVCDMLEQLPSKSYLPAHIQDVLTKIQSAEKVEDFDDVTDTELHEFKNVITNDLPQYHRETTEFIRNLGRAKTIIVDTDDFI